MNQSQEREVIEQFVKLLMDNNRQGQAQDVSNLLRYMEEMNRQFDAVLQTLQEIKSQAAQTTADNAAQSENPVKETAGLEQTGGKVHQAREMLSNLWAKVTDCAKKAVESFKETGVLALDKAVSAMGVKNALGSLQNHFEDMIVDTQHSIEKVETIGHELRSAGGHLKNSGRALTGRETQTIDGGTEGRFQSAVLAPMRTIQNILFNMRSATLAAIDKTVNLAQSAETVRERRAERKAEQARQKPEDKADVRESVQEEQVVNNAAAPVQSAEDAQERQTEQPVQGENPQAEATPRPADIAAKIEQRLAVLEQRVMIMEQDVAAVRGRQPERPAQNQHRNAARPAPAAYADRGQRPADGAGNWQQPAEAARGRQPERPAQGQKGKRRQEEKPSIRETLKQYQSEITSKPAPAAARNKEQEAAR